MKQKFIIYIISIAAMIVLMTSCASGKIVLSNDVNISKYKYVIFGKETSGDRELDDVVMSVQNQIAETNLIVLSSSNILKICECSDSILSPNIHVTSEKWDGGHTYITVTFYDYNTNQSVLRLPNDTPKYNSNIWNGADSMKNTTLMYCLPRLPTLRR